MKTKIYIGFGSVAVILIALLLFNVVGSGAQTGAALADTSDGTISTNTDLVNVPLSEIGQTAKFYSLDVDGVEVRYFAVRGSDGVVRTAFDACDICGGYKGYRQQGDDMVCNNCGLHFSIDDIGVKNRGGGCWPSYLSHEVDGADIVISETEIAAGRWRFA